MKGNAAVAIVKANNHVLSGNAPGNEPDFEDMQKVNAVQMLEQSAAEVRDILLIIRELFPGLQEAHQDAAFEYSNLCRSLKRLLKEINETAPQVIKQAGKKTGG